MPPNDINAGEVWVRVGESWVRGSQIQSIGLEPINGQSTVVHTINKTVYQTRGDKRQKLLDAITPTGEPR